MVDKKQTVLFIDLDETILSNPFDTAVFPLVSAIISQKAALPPESIRKMILSENERRKSDNTIPPALVFDWDDIVNTVAESLKIEFDISIQDLVKQYALSPYISKLDKSVFALKKIRKPHRRIVAATNGLSKYQVPVLRALKIVHLFDDLIAPDISNALKGERNFYGDLLAKAEIVFSVGDSYEYDIIGPKNIGMHTVWLNRSMDPKLSKLSPFERVLNCDSIKYKTVHPDAIILNLAELSSVVDKIEGQYPD